ncbi:MAG: DUF4249 domain-containing protein [Cyclobacteriaceae bacterium]|nr:DUF4249 domain-containing protein [Cyclobacteriaceae bacterium]
MLNRNSLSAFIGTYMFVLLLGACVEPINLPVNDADVNFLAVDAYLDVSHGEANVKLMRAVPINEERLPFEDDAFVAVEDNSNNQYVLSNLDSGRYKLTGFSPSADSQYRLYVKTSNGKEYRSEFVTVKSTPEIKELAWRARSDGTQIVLDTEDEKRETRFYRWNFEETWEYHSRYVSWIKFTGQDVDTILLDIVDSRGPADMIDKCYKTRSSAQILTSSTEGLARDIVNDFEVTFIPAGAERLGYRYSILVKQQAISKETYDYLERLKKTSQDLGGLYAPQPSKVTGNFKNVNNPEETVLGYFDAGYSTEMRLSITTDELPSYLQFLEESPFSCRIDTATIAELPTLYASGAYTLLEYFAGEDDTPIGFTYSTNKCADCRTRGGVATKPPFWP